MTSRISYNIHGNNVPNRQRLLDHLEILEPEAVLVLDSYDLSRQIKNLLPDTTVIYREYEHDKAVHKDFSAQAWLDAHAHQAEGSIVLHVLNEPPFDQAVVIWLTELLRLAAPRRIPLIVGNWAVGNPLPEQWPMARELLQLLDQHRDLFILGLHEYAGGVITSGLYGGYPDNAGVHPGQPGGMNLIQPENWPKDVSQVTRYHMGRFKFMVDYCKSVGLKSPRIILTEHGFDDTSDIKKWEDTLKKNAGYLNIRGWKSLQNQWRDWFGNRGWSPERAYFEMLRWANETIYKNSPVEAQCIFCWGHSSQKWDQFDVAYMEEFQGKLEEYARVTLPQEPPPMQLPLPTDTHWDKITNLSGVDHRVLHMMQLNQTNELAWIHSGDEFYYFPIPDNTDWVYVKTLAGIIGVSQKAILDAKSFPSDSDPRREIRRLTSTGAVTNVRAQPSANSLVLRSFIAEDAMIIPYKLLFNGERFHNALQPPKTGEGFWVPVWITDDDETIQERGWVRSDAVHEDITKSPVPEEETPPVQDVPILIFEMRALTAAVNRLAAAIESQNVAQTALLKAG